MLHAQHVMTTVPSIRAAGAIGMPVVATVRDYWPVCYWSNLIYDPESPHLCPGVHRADDDEVRAAARRRGVGRRLAAHPVHAAEPADEAAHARARRERDHRGEHDHRRRLARARARRSRRRRSTRFPIRWTWWRSTTFTTDPPGPSPEPYILYAGKLATNKGVQFLMPALKAAGIKWPLVVVGDGPMRGRLEAEGRALDIEVRELGWLARRKRSGRGCVTRRCWRFRRTARSR